MSTSLLSFVSLALFVGSAFAVIGPTGNLVLTNAIVSPDGFERSAALASTGVTGELITATKGDNIQINVVNQLTDNTMLIDTSIHWHGFFQKGTNWADGPAFVSQCPIVAGDSFLYNFNTEDQAGTFWYHSHLSTQYCDGVRGAFVVYDPQDPHLSLYDVDDESTVWTLADWYHDPAPTLVVPTPAANLFNGLGRDASSGLATELGVALVTAGTRYRIRLVNIGCDPNYVFSIDSHTMTIIEVDGVSHEALEVDSIQIYAGQRYSFVLNANQAVDNYWIRFNPSIGDQAFDGGINSGILRYVGAAEVEPVTELVSATNALVEANLKPLSSLGFTVPGNPVVGGADININLDVQFTGTGFAVNGASWTSPTVPVLLQVLSGAQSVGNLLPGDSIYELEANKSVEISIPGGAVGGGHPMHLHGHVFDVVRSVNSDVYNYVDPPRRDVVNIGVAGDNVTIRFFTDNPGPWFLHCHIDWHLELGFAVTFAERTDEWAATNLVPTAWDDLCPIYEAEGTSSD